MMGRNVFEFKHVLFYFVFYLLRFVCLTKYSRAFELLAFKMERIDIAIKNIKESEAIQ